MPLKITSWNVEWADKLIKDVDDEQIRDRCDRIYKTICEIDPDIFCLIEGPQGEKKANTFSTEILKGDWVPVLLTDDGGSPGSKDKEYATQGTQWIWFFVKPALKNRFRLQSPSVWTQKTGGNREWEVYYWGQPDKKVKHTHYRHPQVLVYRFDDDREMELIGIHLKSGIPGKPFHRDENGNIAQEFVNDALQSRIKLATEARNVRNYITRRFAECKESSPAILILGDANDGPGQDYFEENYLFFSTVSNLEGTVLDSEQFFNHALFDFDPEECWTIKFKDDVTGLPAEKNPLLIDHILISQSICNGSYPVQANRHAGIVEYKIYDKYKGPAKNRTSDHRPVSIRLT